MAECYCGCGRKFGAFATGRKSANKMGRLVQETLTDIQQELGPQLPEAAKDPKRRAFAEMVVRTRAEGQQFEEVCREVAHYQTGFGDVDWPAIRGWVRNAQGMVSLIRLPPEQQARVMRSG